MNYEEKLKQFQINGEIPRNLLEPLDFFRFIRDGALNEIKYKLIKGGYHLYEVQCTLSNSTVNIDVYRAEDKCNENNDAINDFFLSLIGDKNHNKYIYLDTNFYLVHLELIETYE